MNPFSNLKKVPASFELTVVDQRKEIDGKKGKK